MHNVTHSPSSFIDRACNPKTQHSPSVMFFCRCAQRCVRRVMGALTHTDTTHAPSARAQDRPTHVRVRNIIFQSRMKRDVGPPRACPHCATSLPSSELVAHHIATSCEAAPVTCPACSAVTTRRGELAHHMTLECGAVAARGGFPCGDCDAVLRDHATWLWHVAPFCPSAPAPPCPLCWQLVAVERQSPAADSRATLARHMMICGRNFLAATASRSDRTHDASAGTASPPPSSSSMHRAASSPAPPMMMAQPSSPMQRMFVAAVPAGPAAVIELRRGLVFSPEAKRPSRPVTGGPGRQSPRPEARSQPQHQQHQQRSRDGSAPPSSALAATMRINTTTAASQRRSRIAALANSAVVGAPGVAVAAPTSTALGPWGDDTGGDAADATGAAAAQRHASERANVAYQRRVVENAAATAALAGPRSIEHHDSDNGELIDHHRGGSQGSSPRGAAPLLQQQRPAPAALSPLASPSSSPRDAARSLFHQPGEHGATPRSSTTTTAARHPLPVSSRGSTPTQSSLLQSAGARRDAHFVATALGSAYQGRVARAPPPPPPAAASSIAAATSHHPHHGAGASSSLYTKPVTRSLAATATAAAAHSSLHHQSHLHQQHQPFVTLTMGGPAAAAGGAAASSSSSRPNSPRVLASTIGSSAAILGARAGATSAAPHAAARMSSTPKRIDGHSAHQQLLKATPTLGNRIPLRAVQQNESSSSATKAVFR